MEEFNENSNLIERFFEGKLSEEEKQLVQNKLTSDSEFAKAFQTEEDLVEGIQASGDLAFRKRLDQIHQTKIESPPDIPPDKRFRFTRRIRMLAAVIILAIVAGFSIWQMNRPPFEERIFIAYYEIPSFENLTRGKTIDSDALIVSAKEKFDAKNFQAALIDLNRFLDQNPGDENAELMKGISQLETGDFAGAEQSFQRIPASSQQYDTAIWYLGLTYLRQNKRDAAKSEFRKFVDGDVITGPKRKVKAKTLMDALD